MRDARRAVELAEEGGYRAIYSDAQAQLASSQAASGDIEGALATTREFEARMAEARHIGGQLNALLTRADILANHGRHEEALEAARAAAIKSSSKRRTDAYAQARYLEAWNLSRLGRRDAALEATREAITANARWWSAYAAGLQCDLAQTAASSRTHVDLALKLGNHAGIRTPIGNLCTTAARLPFQTGPSYSNAPSSLG